MVRPAYCLATLYVLFALLLVFEEWYPHHCKVYYTELWALRLVLWVSFAGIVFFSLYTGMGED